MNRLLLVQKIERASDALASIRKLALWADDSLIADHSKASISQLKHAASVIDNVINNTALSAQPGSNEDWARDVVDMIEEQATLYIPKIAGGDVEEHRTAFKELLHDLADEIRKKYRVTEDTNQE